MGFAVIAWDRTDAGALDRRMEARQRHIDVLDGWCRDGRMPLAGPIMNEAGNPVGSVMMLEVDAAGAEQYLREEIFAVEGIWAKHSLLPFRLAPLPYRPQPGVPGGATAAVMGTVIIAMDGTDAEAEARRLAVRPKHFDRIKPEAEAGTVLLGGAILDAPEGRMVGSLVITAIADPIAAKQWAAADPYVQEGVWQDITIHRMRVAPLPYRSLAHA